MLVILDRQHGARGDRFDPGAQATGLREVDLTTGYLLAARRRLEAAGVRVLYIDAGHYSDRHARANEAARSFDGSAVYIAAHVNAGRGDYGAIFHDARSHRGALVALCLKDHLKAALPEAARVKVLGASDIGWTKNAWHTIRRIYDGPANISGICLEPGFIDTPQHAALWTPEGLPRIGAALADGLLMARDELGAL